MAISNQAIADLLLQLANDLEIYAENPYRIRAYRRAARSISKMDKSIHTLIRDEEDLTLLPHIGPSIARLLKQIDKTNKIPDIGKHKIKEKPFRNELLNITGLGTKRVDLLKTEGINTITKLKEAIENGFLQNRFTWFTASFKTKILYNIEHLKSYEKFIKYRTADLIITNIRNKLLSIPEIIKVVPASFYRRKSELVGNVDWVLQTSNDKKAIQFISELDIVREIVKQDEHCITVILHSSLLMTFHLVDIKIFGNALLFYTGSNKHIEALQNYIDHHKIDLQLNNFENNRKFFNDTEEKIYEKIGLSYIGPELREDRGEIEASKKNKLPVLITLDDIKGDLHSHTNETDGTEALEVMVEKAIDLGYEYFAITDHSQRLTITNGLDEKRLLKQIRLIDKLNSKYTNFRILKSIEVDILEDGSLDLSNDVLKELDIRVCSIHSKFNLPEKQQTERIVRAMDNPYFNVLGHMTGRLLTSRRPYELQVENIMIAAKERGCFIELNAQPSRLDINDIYCQKAKEIGVKIAISSDAHSILELSFMQFGVYQARRGWLEKKDVINTRHLRALLKLIKRS